MNPEITENKNILIVDEVTTIKIPNIVNKNISVFRLVFLGKNDYGTFKKYNNYPFDYNNIRNNILSNYIYNYKIYNCSSGGGDTGGGSNSFDFNYEYNKIDEITFKLGDEFICKSFKIYAFNEKDEVVGISPKFTVFKYRLSILTTEKQWESQFKYSNTNAPLTFYKSKFKKHEYLSFQIGIDRSKGYNLSSFEEGQPIKLSAKLLTDDGLIVEDNDGLILKNNKLEFNSSLDIINVEFKINSVSIKHQNKSFCILIDVLSSSNNNNDYLFSPIVSNIFQSKTKLLGLPLTPPQKSIITAAAAATNTNKPKKLKQSSLQELEFIRSELQSFQCDKDIINTSNYLSLKEAINLVDDKNIELRNILIELKKSNEFEDTLNKEILENLSTFQKILFQERND